MDFFSVIGIGEALPLVDPIGGGQVFNHPVFLSPMVGYIVHYQLHVALVQGVCQTLVVGIGAIARIDTIKIALGIGVIGNLWIVVFTKGGRPNCSGP